MCKEDNTLRSCRKLLVVYKILLFPFSFTKKGRNLIRTINNTIKEIDELENQILLFNERFAGKGWCVYGFINTDLVRKCNLEYDRNGVESAESILIQYFKTDAKEVTFLIQNSSDVFRKRHELLKLFFEDHFNGRYHSSVLLGLSIIDGTTNDFTKGKGFFTETIDLDAKESIVGEFDGFKVVHKEITKSRKTTNETEIDIPYRNGIMHGRELKFNNEVVSCKVLALMFAVASWINKKENEKKENEGKPQIGSLRNLLARINDLEKMKIEANNWKPSEIKVGIDIPTTGSIEDFSCYPKVRPIISIMDAWKNKNYGVLAKEVRYIAFQLDKESKRAGECRECLKDKKFISFEIMRVEEKSLSAIHVWVTIRWEVCNTEVEEEFEIRCVYDKDDSSELIMPSKQNGEWTVRVWNINRIFDSNIIYRKK